ncbi:hypothetical protein Tco_0266040 [Tanacetum coccineum]
MQAARDRQKSYADLKRKPMEFQVGDKVMLKVSPWKGVVRFGKRGKLNPRYVGPFKVLEKVGEVAYKLELPEELSRVHNTFHFVEEPVEIMDREVKRLKRSHIPLVKAALQAPPSLDYVSGPEEPEQAPPSLDYVPGPEHADDEIFAEYQPYAEDASPNAQSPDYVSESDHEADPEEDDDEDPEEDPEDEDDDVDIEADEDEEEEEHPAPADSLVVTLPAADQAPFAEETEPFETESAATPPPHLAYRVTARISIPAPVPTPVWSDAEVARLLAISTTVSLMFYKDSTSRDDSKKEINRHGMPGMHWVTFWIARLKI